jgi:phosphatidylserine/phosphatidylglycerophosphate/cardiolipin synthase-like enzyme
MERTRRSAMTILTWFHKDALCPLISDHAVILGGTRLVDEFIGLVEESAQPGHFVIGVPFITPTLVEEVRTWQGIVHQRLDCTLVTRNTKNASCRSIQALPWRSLRLQEDAGIHAKTYGFKGEDGYSAALVGSHNFTFAGTRHNREAGVLLISRTPSELTSVIDECITHITSAGTTSYDTMTWPEEQTKGNIA